MYNNKPLTERILCSIGYLSFLVPLTGFIPLVWIILGNLRKVHMSEFAKYHCYQAVMFSMIIYFFPRLISLLLKILNSLLAVFGDIFIGTIGLLNTLSVIFFQAYFYAAAIVTVYAVVWTIRSKYTYMPPISQAVNSILR
jgi:hypothetical protein